MTSGPDSIAHFSPRWRLVGTATGLFLVLGVLTACSQAAATSCSESEQQLAQATGGSPDAINAATAYVKQNPTADLPKSGWKIARVQASGMSVSVLQSGASQLYAIQGADGTWQVASGTLCK